jgi:hypothetical protein
MEHQQQLTVEFTGSISRQITENGAVKKYFRNNFMVDGQVKSISSPDDLAGLNGTVMFVKAGSEKPGGGTVTQDAFTLLGVTSLQALRNKIERKSLEAQAATV